MSNVLLHPRCKQVLGVDDCSQQPQSCGRAAALVKLCAPDRRCRCSSSQAKSHLRADTTGAQLVELPHLWLCWEDRRHQFALIAPLYALIVLLGLCFE